MKNEFELLDGEKIIYEGDCSNVKKTNKQVGRIITGVFAFAFFWYLDYLMLTKTIDFISIIITLVLILMTICFLYATIYDLFLYSKTNDEKYFVTDKRIIFIKKGKVKYGFVDDLWRIGITREKNNYSDMTFVFKNENLEQYTENSIEFNARDLMEQLKNGIEFKAVYEPRVIVDELLKINNEIQLYDDKPTGMFERWFK